MSDMNEKGLTVEGKELTPDMIVLLKRNGIDINNLDPDGPTLGELMDMLNAGALKDIQVSDGEIVPADK